MANHHLRNKGLSLKAKGLLSLMLSLPEDWDYTVKGLAYICKDGIDSINGAIKELETTGYMHRQRVRNHAEHLFVGSLAAVKLVKNFAVTQKQHPTRV